MFSPSTHQFQAMTTHSFTHFVRTMEGQYQVALGHLLAKESSEGNISRILPTKDPIIIRNRKNTGIYNPNMEKKTLAIICSYIQCPPVTADCSTTVRPLGHCCDICGSVLTFASNHFTVTSICEVVEAVIKDKNLHGLIRYSVERINNEEEDEVIPRYQIAGFPSKKYDDTVFAIFTLEMHNRLGSSRVNLMGYLGSDYQWSRLDHSYSLASKIAGFVTFCFLILVGVTLSLSNNIWQNRNATSSFHVAWHQGDEDDDVVQLLNSTEDNITEEADEIPSTLLLRDTSTPILLRPEKQNLSVENDIVGTSDLEMQLIK
ncbi:hypothetical protein DICVIV_10997 [Dictyocaulus viviparus]|uniref:Uncharacterized protein n=1 Tax=Dictyocaulus viviparus TaxID=29172 RepID=A0A0D8XEI8_DICVI|nr:hypothetical protein DICVIV_10997 [Dictyocaulus viviparus]